MSGDLHRKDCCAAHQGEMRTNSERGSSPARPAEIKERRRNCLPPYPPPTTHDQKECINAARSSEPHHGG